MVLQMTTVVFGGGGFIGQDLIQKLDNQGHSVVCADIQWPETLTEVADCRNCDVTDYNRVVEIIQTYQPSHVFHLAYMMVAETSEQPRYATSVNCQGTANVMHAAAINGVERLIYASSIGVYGDPEDYAERITEDVNTAAAFNRFPVTLYAAMKQMDEYQGRFYADNFPLSVAAVRPNVIFGPGSNSGLADWTSSFIAEPARGGVGHIPRPHDQELNLVYLDDVSDLFLRLHDAEVIEQHAYNTGGHQVTVQELIQVITDELDGTVTCDETGGSLPPVTNISHERASGEFNYKLTPLRDAIAHHAAEVLDGS